MAGVSMPLRVQWQSGGSPALLQRDEKWMGTALALAPSSPPDGASERPLAPKLQFSDIGTDGGEFNREFGERLTPCPAI